MRAVKNIFLLVILLGVIILSFWVSFLLSKNMLMPAKNIPTTDLLTLEAEAIKNLDKLTFEVGAISLEAQKAAIPTKMVTQCAAAKKAVVAEKPVAKPVAKPATKTVKKSSAYIVQCGIFSKKANANAIVEELGEHGYTGQTERIGKNTRVFLPATSLNEAKEIADDLTEKGIESVVRRK